MYNSNKMGNESIGKLLVSMSMPAMLSMFIHALYNILDSIFVANLNADALSAVTLVFPFQFLMIAVGVGTGIGLNSLISRRLGAALFEAAEKAINAGLFLGIISGLIFAFIGNIFAEEFIGWFTEEAVIYKYGMDYMQIISGFCMFSMTTMLIEKMLQAQGNMHYPMMILTAGAVVNTILDPVLIYGMWGAPRLEVKGAALATIVAQIVSFSLAIFLASRKNIPISIKLDIGALKYDVVKEIYAVGAPAIVMQSLISVMLFGINSILASFSQTAVAVMGIYGRLQTFVFMPIIGINQGALPIMGYNYGAGDMKRLKKTYKLASIAAAAMACIGFLAVQIFPEVLLGMFNAKDEMMRIGKDALGVVSICFIPASFGIIASGLFQSTGHGFMSMWGSVLRQFAGILPLAYLFAYIGGLDMIWWAFPGAEIIGAGYYIVVLKYVYRIETAKKLSVG